MSDELVEEVVHDYSGRLVAVQAEAELAASAMNKAVDLASNGIIWSSDLNTETIQASIEEMRAAATKLLKITKP